MNVESPSRADSPHTSYSQLTSWLKCGKAYELQKVIGLHENPAWWSIGGSAFHEATEHNDLRRFALTGK